MKCLFSCFKKKNPICGDVKENKNDMSKNSVDGVGYFLNLYLV
jgi:hypothetical protein